jgi:hypothetical protein
MEVPHFDGNNFVSWKSQISTYLREMNPQVWWMVDVGLSHALEGCLKTQAQKKWLYLEAHTSNGLFSALSAEIKDEIKMEYGWPERGNLLWNVFEQMYGSNNSKKSSSSDLENISSSSTHFDQEQEEQSSVQKELNSASLKKSDGPILAEQKMSYLKKMIALHRVSTSMIIMTQMMSMMNKSSWWNLRKLEAIIWNCKRDMEIFYVLIKNLLTHMHC